MFRFRALTQQITHGMARMLAAEQNAKNQTASELKKGPPKPVHVYECVCEAPECHVNWTLILTYQLNVLSCYKSDEKNL